MKINFKQAVIAWDWKKHRAAVALAMLGLMVAVTVFILLAQNANTEVIEPICGVPEHTHTDECYRELVCTIPENHVHTDACYEDRQVLICGYEEGEEIEPGVFHHHDDSCYETERVLVCDIPEGHVHDDSCYIIHDEPICGLEEHTHTTECYPDETTPGDEPGNGVDDEGDAIVPDEGDGEGGPGDEQVEEPAEEPPEEPPEFTGDLPEYDEYGNPYGYATASEETPESPFMGIMALGMPIGAQGSNADLFKFVTGVAIRDSNGQLITNGQFLYGETYSFDISFAEGANQFEYNDGYLYYDLPEELQIPFDVSNGEILLPNGKVCGWYNLSTDGSVEVWFDDVDNQGNNISPTNFIDRYSNVSFSLTVKAKFEQGTQAGQVLFGAGAEVTITQIQEPAVGLRVDKSATAFNKNDETVDFTVRVTAVGGPVDNITLNDILRITGNNIPSNQYYISETDMQNANVSFTHEINGSGVWNSITPTWDGNQMTFSFGSLILQKDGYITLKYSMPLEDVLDYMGMQTASGSNRWIQRLMYNLNLNNTATGNGRNFSTKAPLPPASAQTNTTISKTFLTKDGVAQSVGGNNEIKWTAAAGDGTMKLNGNQLVDTFSGGARTMSGDITVRLYGAPNASGTFTSPQTITISSPYTDSGLTLTGTISAPTGFTYTVPDGYGGISDIYRVEFVYNTTAPSGGSYSNEISLTLPNGNKSAVRKDIVGVGFSAIKTSKWIVDNGAIVGISYTSVVVIPAGNKNRQISVLDQLQLLPNYNHAFIVNTAVDLTVTIDGPEPDFEYTFYDNNVWNFELWFGGTDIKSRANSVWQYDEQKTLTITYTLMMDTPVLSNPYGYKTLKDVFYGTRDALTFEGLSNIVGVIDYQLGEAVANRLANVEAYDYWPIYKEAHETSPGSGVFDYTVYIQGPGHNHGFFTSGSAVKFEDLFDPRLEYVEKSFYALLINPAGTSINITNIGGTTYDYIYGPYESSPTSGQSGTPYTVGSARVVEFNDPNKFQVNNTTGTINADLSKFRVLVGLGFTPSPSTASIKDAYLVTPLTSTWAYYTYSVAKIELHYQLKVKDEYKLDEFTAGNTASVTGTGDKLTGKISDSATVKYGNPPVKKDIAAISGNTLDTEIVINENGAKLIPDGAPDQEKFHAVDTMDGDLAFYLSTIDIYTQGGSIGNWDGVWKTTPESISTVPDSLFSVNFIDSQTVDFVLPDKTPIKIVYKALITVPIGEYATFHNQISVYGYSDFFAKDHFLVQSSGASAFGDDFPLRVYKTDESTGQRISGTDAEFAMYIAMDNGDKPFSGYSLDATHPPITVGSKTFYYLLDSYAMGSGEYGFYDNALYGTNHGLIFANSPYTYLIVETKAPAGYQLPTGTNNRTFLVLRSLGSADRLSLQMQLGATVNVVADTFVLSNKPQKGSFAIHGDKTVLTATGETIPDSTFTFVLKKLIGFTYEQLFITPYDPVYDSPSNWMVKNVDHVTQEGIPYLFEFTLDDLEDGEYYYEMTEVQSHGDDENWNCDTRVYVCRVVVNNGEAIDGGITMVGGSTPSSNPLVRGAVETTASFVNVYGKGGPILPETGGVGDWIYAILGLSLMLFAGWRLLTNRRTRLKYCAETGQTPLEDKITTRLHRKGGRYKQRE